MAFSVICPRRDPLLRWRTFDRVLALDELALLGHLGGHEIEEHAHARRMAQIGMGQQPQIGGELRSLGARRTSAARASAMKQGRWPMPMPASIASAKPSTVLTL